MMTEDNVNALRAMAEAVGDMPDDETGKRTFRQFLLDSANEIVELRNCIHDLCPEIAARKMLSFATAEAIFSS